MEACSIIIANSDVLSALFDCSLYPESNDPLICEDPTRRRDYCYDKEFQCYDGSCIPQQWQCDNIKDCSNGEEEDNCLLCDHEKEFRCHSNEKCLDESMRCDAKFDCFDGSDEEDCDGYGSDEKNNFGESAFNSFPRLFSYTRFVPKNRTSDNLFSFITTDSSGESPLPNSFKMQEITNRTSGISNEEITNAVPGENGKGFGTNSKKLTQNVIYNLMYINIYSKL